MTRTPCCAAAAAEDAARLERFQAEQTRRREILAALGLPAAEIPANADGTLWRVMPETEALWTFLDTIAKASGV